MSATDYVPTQLEANPIEPGPRIPSPDESARVSSALLDVEEHMLDPWARCVFQLVNEETPAAVTFEEIGRLGVSVGVLRQVLRRMLEHLDRLDLIRDDLGQIATDGRGLDLPRFDAQGSRVPRAVNAFGNEIPWEMVTDA